MIHQIEVYCNGAPNGPHERRYIARMVRTMRMDDTSGWTVARDAGRQHRANDWDRNRFDLRCRCGISAQVVMDETQASQGRIRLMRAFDTAAGADLPELPLHALAGIVAR